MPFNISNSIGKYAKNIAGGKAGLWLAVGDIFILRSTNTTTWTASTDGGFTNTIQNAAYGKDGSGVGLWVAGGNGTNKIATSSDGINWSGFNLTFFTICWSVAYGKDGSGAGLWVATGSGTNKIATSPNGTSWTGISANDGLTIGRNVKYANNLWVAVGEGNAIATSTDGTNWTGFPLANNGNINVGYSASYGNGLWVVVGSNTAGSAPKISYSSDNGTSWTAGTSFGSLTGIFDVKYANGIWVAGGTGGNAIITSTDGINWSNVSSVSFGAGGYLTGIDYGRDGSGNGVWVAVGKNGTFNASKSTNGTTWTGISTVSQSANKIVFAQTN